MLIPDECVERLRVAQRVTVLTGPGVAAESGVLTFREAQVGEWARYDPRDLATPEAFLRNPRLVWDWYTYRRQLIEQAEPNAGHYALVDLEQRYAQFLLITQNTDGLHWRAGSRDLVELHGNLRRTRCFELGHVIDVWDESGELPPPCPICGGPLRPDVIWFGEGLPERALREARRASDHCDVFLAVGTAGMVQPAATLPRFAQRHGAYVVEITAEDAAALPVAHCTLRGSAAQVLPELVRRLQRAREVE